MIKGKAKLEMGTGDIKITAALVKDSIGLLCFATEEPHKIGEIVKNEMTWTPNKSQVILSFSKVESIDVLIKNLEEVKRLMNGNFNEADYFTDNEFNLDLFMIDNVKEILEK